MPSLDLDAWQRLEPGTASPLQRLRAVCTLVDAGIHCGVLMAPLVPGITTRRSLIEDTVKAAADHGAVSIGAMVLHLEGGARAHFMRVLAAEYPQLVDGYERLFTAKYAPPAYTGEVGRMVGLLKAKYGWRPVRNAPERRRPRPPRSAYRPFDGRERLNPRADSPSPEPRDPQPSLPRRQHALG